MQNEDTQFNDDSNLLNHCSALQSENTGRVTQALNDKQTILSLKYQKRDKSNEGVYDRIRARINKSAPDIITVIILFCRNGKLP